MLPALHSLLDLANSSTFAGFLHAGDLKVNGIFDLMVHLTPADVKVDSLEGKAKALWWVSKA